MTEFLFLSCVYTVRARLEPRLGTTVPIEDRQPLRLNCPHKHKKEENENSVDRSARPEESVFPSKGRALRAGTHELSFIMDGQYDRSRNSFSYHHLMDLEKRERKHLRS